MVIVRLDVDRFICIAVVVASGVVVVVADVM